MVVLAASIISKSGKALVSRQFVDMTRARIEGLLAAFPKLVGTGKQHTYVETDNVRYVYQPIESLYLLVVTNKQSNILEDVETLRLLSKIVPEYSSSLDEEGVCRAAFELIFAFDEVIFLGHKESVTVAQVKQYCEMDSHEEKLHKLVLLNKINETKDLMKRKASEIDKSKTEKAKGTSFTSIGASALGRLDNSFGDISTASSSAFNVENDYVSKSSKSRPSSSATAPAKVFGMQLGKTPRTNQFLESLKAEGEVIIEDVKPSSAGLGNSRPAISAAIPTDPITLTIEEKLNVTLKRDGGVGNFDIQGTLSLQILSPDDACIQVYVESRNDPDIAFKTHPNINRELYSSQGVLGLKDASRPFPAGQAGDGVQLLKWRMQSADKFAVPITINCWLSVSGDETYVSIEYEASSLFDLRNVLISVPLPALRDPPTVRQIEGDWRYNPRASTFDWSILLIDETNRSGSMEFVVPAVDGSAFFPISVKFSAPTTYSGLKVVSIVPMRAGAGTTTFSQHIQLVADNYKVV